MRLGAPEIRYVFEKALANYFNARIKTNNNIGALTWERMNLRTLWTSPCCAAYMSAVTPRELARRRLRCVRSSWTTVASTAVLAALFILRRPPDASCRTRRPSIGDDGDAFATSAGRHRVSWKYARSFNSNMQKCRLRLERPNGIDSRERPGMLK